jgi:CheY-like chemotaxis protein
MHGSQRSLRIMVVDDNVDAASILVMLLEASGQLGSVEHGSPRTLARAHTEAPHGLPRSNRGC